MSRRIEVAAAVNNRDILDACLKRSPAIASGTVSLKTYEGYATAGAAYNDAIEAAEGDILILVHQDVYLPSDFLSRLSQQLDHVDSVDPSWAVAGAVGMGLDGRFHGSFWTSGLQVYIDASKNLPSRAESFDEVLLIIRLDAGLRFDEVLPSFHLYGTDIAQIARSAKRTCWVLHLPIVHHSGTVMSLLGPYTKAYLYLRRKWRDQLPIRNLTFDVSRSFLPLIYVELRLRWNNLVRPRKIPPNGDVVEIARRHKLEA
jgi:glycosyltransferase involved in cell wall biosynthesis